VERTRSRPIPSGQVTSIQAACLDDHPSPARFLYTLQL
jgi:hypothetical protein